MHEQSQANRPGHPRPRPGSWEISLRQRTPVADASLLVQILPYLGQQPLFNAINMSDMDEFSVLTNANTTASMNVPSSFICPAEPVGPRDERDRTNYAGNAGENSLRGEGVFIGKSLSSAEIPDGLSQTVGVSEWIAGVGTPQRADRLGSIFGLPPATTPNSLMEFRSSARALPPARRRSSSPKRASSGSAEAYRYSQYNHALTPNRPSCAASDFRATTAGSRHVRGANALTMDGSVHFVKDSIDAPRLVRSRNQDGRRGRRSARLPLRSASSVVNPPFRSVLTVPSVISTKEKLR